MSTQPAEETRVFIGGISKATTTDSLRRCLDRHGVIDDLFYPVDKQGLHKGFAIVTYSSAYG
jgi:RNA recognition motif-containing protein